jgi:hypothetical protein
LVRDEPRDQAGIPPDIPETTRRPVVVTHEIQMRAVDADYALRSGAEATAVECDRRSEDAEGGSIAGGEDDGVEWLFQTVDEPYSLGRELLKSAPQLNAPGPDAVGQMESNEGNRGAGVFTRRRQRRRAAKAIGKRARDSHGAPKHRRRQRVEDGADVLDRDAEQLSGHDPRSGSDSDRDLSPGRGEFGADFSGRVSRTDYEHPLARERLRNPILDAVDDAALEPFLQRYPRHVRIRNDPGRGDDNA